jgi:PAS domain S-box-containing protein
MQQNEDFYKRILQHIHTGFAFCKFHSTPDRKTDFDILDVNQPFADLFGKFTQDIVGKRFSELKNNCSDRIEKSIVNLILRSDSKEPVSRIVTSGTDDLWVTMTLVKESEEFFSILIDKTSNFQASGNTIDAGEDSRKQKLIVREQNRRLMLEMLAEGKPIDHVLFYIAKSIEDEHEEVLCSILVFDKTTQSLKHIAAPSLPEFYNKFVDGLPVDYQSDSSGKSIFSNKRNIVEDISADPVWKDILPLAKKAGVSACWSEPILAANGNILGVISLYHRHPHYPAPDEIDSVEFSIELARIAIEKKSSDDQLTERVGRFRNMVESSQAGYFYIDNKGYFKFVNHSWLMIYKYDYLNEIIGKHYSMVIPEHDLWNFTQSFERMLKRNTGGSGEFLHKCKDGTIGYHTLSANPVMKSGKVMGIEGFIIDISSYREAITSLTISEKKLRELNESKDKFLSIIAHDLKTPFTGILGFSYLLIGKAENSDFAKVKQYSQIIYDSAHSCHLLLDNLLQWSRAQAGSIDYNPEVFRINDILNETIRTASISLLSKRIVLENLVQKDIIVYADQKMISTVLRNLISNAMKFTRREGIITVNYELSDHQIQISITDTGIGLSPEKIEKLFGSQVKLTTPGTGNEHGTGLGLMICREFIGMNKGNLWVESEEGKGSTFYFTVPRYPSGFEIDE